MGTERNGPEIARTKGNPARYGTQGREDALQGMVFGAEFWPGRVALFFPIFAAGGRVLFDPLHEQKSLRDKAYNDGPFLFPNDLKINLLI